MPRLIRGSKLLFIYLFNIEVVCNIHLINYLITIRPLWIRASLTRERE